MSIDFYWAEPLGRDVGYGYLDRSVDAPKHLNPRIVINDESSVTVGTLGLRDMVVLVTKDAVLVCPKDQAQRVRLITQAIAAR